MRAYSKPCTINHACPLIHRRRNRDYAMRPPRVQATAAARTSSSDRQLRSGDHHSTPHYYFIKTSIRPCQTRCCYVTTPMQSHNTNVPQQSFNTSQLRYPPYIWSLLRRFDNPQAYKHFLKGCQLLSGDGRAVGTLREVQVISGLPAGRSTERLDILDEDRHVIGYSVVGGDHRLSNYRSVTTLHPSAGCGGSGTVVVESYEVDVPVGNTKEDTCVFVDTIVRCNLQSLAQIAQAQSKAAATH